MIKFKERFEDDWRLFDTETGKYVQNTAENRCRAMFCLIVATEANKENKGEDDRYNVEELAEIYEATLLENRHLKNPSRIDLEKFIYRLDSKIGLGNLAADERFEGLAAKVLLDQQKDSTWTTKENIETLKNDYSYMDNYIFENGTEEIL